MKILAIRLKNLASLEGFTEIDFMKPPLSTAGIFAITGLTGAGKSTILDALCLALYGKTPRYLQAKEQGIEVRDGKTGSISQGDCRGILRDGTGEGFAEVDFKGIDGHIHSATWRVRRARDKADGLMQSDSLELKNLDSGTNFPGRKKDISEEIERLIGLNFEQFTRSVLLAQGDFTAFLKAAKDDKSSLLEKLTGTHIYSEISRRIFENSKAQEQSLRELNFKREDIPTLTTEELASLEGRNKTAKSIIEIKQVELAFFDKEISWHHLFKTMLENLELAEKLKGVANEKKQSSSDRLAILNQVEAIQPARKLIDTQNDIAGQLYEKNENLAIIKNDLSALNERQIASVAAFQTVSKVWEESTVKYNLAIPKLAEARELDVKIFGKLEQVNNAEAIVKIAVDVCFQKEQKIVATTEKNEYLLNAVKLLEQWKKENESRQPIAEQDNLILSKLKDARQLLIASGSNSKQIVELSGEIIKETEKAKQLRSIAEHLKINLITAQSSLQILTQKIAEVSITELDVEKISVDNMRADLASAQSVWENYFEKIKEFNQLTKDLNNSKAEHKEKVPRLAIAADKLRTVKTQKETSLELLQKIRLAVSENIESLRAQLVEEEPCPVCGSLQHPYSVHNPQLDVVMQKIEIEYKQYAKVFEEALALHSALQENIVQLNKAMDAGEKGLREKEKNLRTINNKWDKLPVYELIQNITEEERADWFIKRIEHNYLLQNNLVKKIAFYNLHKKDQEEIQKQIYNTEQQVNESSTSLRETEQAEELLQQQLSFCKVENDKLSGSLKQIETSLAIYFPTDDWFNKWKAEPAAFEENISTFSSKWKEQTEKLANDTNELYTTQATLTEQQLQLQNLLTEQENKQTILLDLQQQYDGLFQQRQLIFNGTDTKLIEAALKNDVEKALQNLDLQKAADQQLKTAIARVGAQLEHLQKDIEQLQERQLNANGNVEHWLTTFNQKHALDFDISKLLELLKHTSEWIEEERTALRAIDDNVTQAQSVLQERTIRLKQHEQNRMSDRDFEELEILRLQSATVLQHATHENTETGLWLRQDEANKKKIGDLLQAINEQALITDNWAKLNEIIGSQDGKKFRQIAQEYTLDVLLGYANMHLQTLSQRYLLERISNTLGLQVLDQDMGNEVRTVFSLSGGESFLVSLALALGLASLSSSRMQVESLFIDEGFGSLDPATLNIAMDALERLHNQGRKVGVISHVQEMTERIPVQIKVSKENSGRSKVQVIGF